MFWYFILLSRAESAERASHTYIYNKCVYFRYFLYFYFRSILIGGGGGWQQIASASIEWLLLLWTYEQLVD